MKIVYVFAVLTLSCLFDDVTSAAVPRLINQRRPLQRHALRKRLFANPKTTYPPTTTVGPGTCFYNGQYYHPGEIINNTPCNMIMCGTGGYLIYGDCTVAPYPTTTPPTTPPTTRPYGCYESGTWYPPNTDISQGADYDSNWCYGTYCDSTGQIIHWDNFNCYKSTTPPTTVPPTTIVTTFIP